MPSVAIVEDEEDLMKMLKLYLEKDGFLVYAYKSISEIKEDINNIMVDLYIIDIMLPDGSGTELLPIIQSMDKKSILMSARGDSIDRALGFSLGCDDYIIKPFLPIELMHRVRRYFSNKDKKCGDIDKIGKEYYINKSERKIYFKNDEIPLTSKEYELILYFIKNKNIALSRDVILMKIWGDDYFGSDRAVDNFVKKIRKKLPILSIETIYGYGYRCNI